MQTPYYLIGCSSYQSKEDRRIIVFHFLNIFLKHEFDLHYFPNFIHIMYKISLMCQKDKTNKYIIICSS